VGNESDADIDLDMMRDGRKNRGLIMGPLVTGRPSRLGSGALRWPARAGAVALHASPSTRARRLLGPSRIHYVADRY
jgi:hypothetical protein